ncbi:MAG: hypothetical protein ABSC41_21085 [Acidimicrobiales bacterium]
MPIAFADKVGRAARGYQTCKQLGIGPYPDEASPGVPPAATAIAHGALTAVANRPLPFPAVDLVESDGPAACASGQFSNANGSNLYVIMSPSLTPIQAHDVESEEADYLRNTRLFDTVSVYPPSAD